MKILQTGDNIVNTLDVTHTKEHIFLKKLHVKKEPDDSKLNSKFNLDRTAKLQKTYSVILDH